MISDNAPTYDPLLAVYTMLIKKAEQARREKQDQAARTAVDGCELKQEGATPEQKNNVHMCETVV